MVGEQQQESQCEAVFEGVFKIAIVPYNKLPLESWAAYLLSAFWVTEMW